MLKTS
jgi:hypothetical protein